VDVKKLKAAFEGMIEESMPEAHDKLRLRVMVFRIIDRWNDATDHIGELTKRLREFHANLEPLDRRMARLEKERAGN
jgi:hypothetical protein